MHRAELVVRFRKEDATRRAAFTEKLECAECVARPAELQPHQDHQAETEEQKAQRGDSVLDADPLVIGRENVLSPERKRVTGDAMLLLFLLAQANGLAKKFLRVVRVQPLRSDSELFSLRHA